LPGDSISHGGDIVDPFGASRHGEAVKRAQAIDAAGEARDRAQRDFIPARDELSRVMAEDIGRFRRKRASEGPLML